MRRTLTFLLLTALTSTALANPPRHHSRLKGTLPPEYRVSAVPQGPVETFDDIPITGKFAHPEVYYVITRAQVKWDELEMKQDFVKGILLNAEKRPF